MLSATAPILTDGTAPCFQGTPHVDHQDVAFQYAVSLGDFVGGGELCIEDADHPDAVWVVETKDRVASEPIRP